ncbi:hypothetical protein VSX64_00840 [Aurantimonas sp. C2-6-R+9]|uniref:hypothetical protein n=1 Tax=unclassified Aurantimonas TaxID=2638230 RepID=UPI002E19BE0C|nr:MULTISPECIES: hypothetical protein [unclassified Aurantimonas]MEC5288986.1 hypothetical protein [Aurantimonas sp. C2-3-R2]MEC5379439.1 hypothetical protein [Aurantimonas sp. C2-6-R+9]MEC5410192.1 hypothetical protein [Aurantimonas sp. C2-4-R8]
MTSPIASGPESDRAIIVPKPPISASASTATKNAAAQKPISALRARKRKRWGIATSLRGIEQACRPRCSKLYHSARQANVALASLRQATAPAFPSLAGLAKGSSHAQSARAFRFHTN